MSEQIFPLLGVINQGVLTGSAIREKFVIRITAEQLALLLQYERKGTKKSAPFKILASSLIKIDKKIQRGADDQGYLQQQPSKIVDIAKTLLGDSSAAMGHAYLGTLVWNVRRPESTLEVIELQRPAGPGGQLRPPEYRLRIDTDAIFLTDSAHRHFGIVEAFRIWKTKPQDYPKFSPKLEFAVEVHNLDKQGEHELFYELNGKQKKASPAKLKELDVSSPIGALRNAVLSYDESERAFLVNNIEVTSVQNRHTLMTMSVFVSTIAEMFSSAEIKAAREEEDAREEYAAYYSAFLYKLADTIVVRCDVDGSGTEVDVKPFWNLHSKFIQSAVDMIQPAAPEESQKRIVEASEKAKAYHDRVRDIDIANNNAMLRALFRLGGKIRHMEDWPSVIDRLQTDLVVSADGKFFQKENRDWFDAKDDVPIASMNKDSRSINVQVQGKNISKIYDYLLNKLELSIAPVVFTSSEGGPLEVRSEQGFVWLLHSSTDNIKAFQLRFVAPRSPLGYEDQVGLTVECDDWKAANFKGAAKLDPTLIEEDLSYQHPSYSGLARYTAFFELKLPAAAKKARLKMTFTYPELDREKAKVTVHADGTIPQ